MQFRRIDSSRRIRSAPGRARNTTEAVMALAQFARERHRLEQERQSLDRRLAKIQKRLGAIADTETRLVPMIHAGIGPAADAATPPPPAARTHHVLPGVTAVTLQY